MLRQIFIPYTNQRPLFRSICKCVMSCDKAIVNRNTENVVTETLLTAKELENEIIDWDKELYKLKEAENRSPLDPPTENLSEFAPYLRPTFNFAAYIDRSKSLQEFVKLGVDLSILESKRDIPEFILSLDYDKDVKDRLLFLNDFGVPVDELGKYITKNPLILKEDMDDMLTRIYYLQYKRFQPDMISRIITKNPFWLSISTKEIDTRLGHFQSTFELTGNEIRSLATMQPRLITYKMSHIRENTFSIKEEMGFQDHEVKALLLKKPRLWMQSRKKLFAKFHYVHNIMKISHEHIMEHPEILYSREFIIKQRDSFLKHLNKNQYDRTKPNYVSLKSLVEGTDIDFCTKVAKTPIETYNLFLRTL